MAVKCFLKAIYVVDNESERSTIWPENCRVFCKDTGKEYVLKYSGDERIWICFLPTKSDKAQTDGDGYCHGTFGTPFPDNNYTIAFGVFAGIWSVCASIDESTQTEYGFDIYTRYSQSGVAAPNIKVGWTATPNYNL